MFKFLLSLPSYLFGCAEKDALALHHRLLEEGVADAQIIGYATHSKEEKIYLKKDGSLVQGGFSVGIVPTMSDREVFVSWAPDGPRDRRC